MTYALTCSASSIFQADSPVESDVPLKPASMRIFPSSLQIGSTWITNVQPYGPEDGYIFSTREHCGLSILHSQNMQVSKLTGIIQENTKLLAASKQNVIAQNPTALDFSREKERLFLCDDGGLSMIDLNSGKPLSLSLDLHPTSVSCNPFDANLLTFTTNNHLYLCDNREEVALFKTQTAKKSTKWSPIVPYWLATTTDNTVDIYDLRFGIEKPMRSFKQYSVNALAWSNSNADIFCTSSSDRSLSLWSLAKPDGPMDSIPHYRTGVFASRTEPNSFHGVSVLAKVVRVDVDQDYLWTVAPTTGQVDEAVERSLYCRDFESVQLAISSMIEDDGLVDTKYVETLIERIYKEEIVADFTVKSEQDQQVFEDDLKHKHLCLPKSHLNIMLISREAPLQASIEMVRIKLALKEPQQEQQLHTLIDSFQSRNLASMPSSLLFEVMCKMMSGGGGGDRRAALEKAIQMLPLLGQRLDADGCRIVHLLLYPTIFDEAVSQMDDQEYSAPKPEPNRPVVYNTIVEAVKKETPIDLRRAVKTTKTAVQMVATELIIDKRFDEATVKQAQTSISFQLHWKLLQSFISKGQLDDYFLHIIALQKQHPTASPCHRLLAWHRDQKVVPKLDFVFEQAAAEKRPTLSLRCLLTVCRIVQASLQASVALSAPVDASAVAEVRAVLRGHKMSECMWFGGYDELKAALTHINLRDRQLKRIVSSALLKELHLLHSKLL